MQIEILGLFGAFILILFLFAEAARRREIGMIASLLLLILGAVILTDGIQFVAGTAIATGGC
jgi:hypothetical protein